MNSEESEQMALVHVPVLELGADIIYVARRTETMWFVAGADFTDDEPSAFQQVQLAELLERAPSLVEVLHVHVGQYASRVDHSEPWTYGLIPVGATFLITFDARPGESNPKRHELGGAIVNCWVIADSLDAALTHAREELATSGWVIVERIEAQPAGVEDFDHDPYFRQAQVDGMVVVFNTYPRDELELN